MSMQTPLEVGRAPITTLARSRPTRTGTGHGLPAASILGLQRAAGNSAVVRHLAAQRSSAGARGRPSALAVQRCGPIPCNCSAEERADHAAKHPEEEAAEYPRAASMPIQRAGVDGEEELASNPVGDPPLLNLVGQDVGAVREGGKTQEEGEEAQEGGVRSGPAPVQRATPVVQRAGDPAKKPAGLACPPDLSAGAPAGTNILFPIGSFGITPAHTLTLTTVLATWMIGGGTDDIIVHGYASKVGDEGKNWTLSCDRANAVRAELERLGIPPVRIKVLAHGKTDEFGAGRDANQRAVVTTRRAGPISLPLVGGVLTPRDNFTGRSTTRFGVGETIDLSFSSLPPTPPAAFGGLEWQVAAGGGTLAGGGAAAGTATYTAPATAGPVTLELRVAGGATAGRVISTHALTIVTPDSVRITEVPGTAPNTSPTGGTIPAGTWGAGFLGTVFVGPRDVSFQGVVFGEGTVGSVITGSFLAPLAGAHPVNTFGPGHGGNATTGTPVSPPNDQIAGAIGPIAPGLLGVRVCGVSDFLWAIPWEFSVAGGPRTSFATANHHMTSSLFCDATIEKGGAGPFTRPI